MPSGAKDTKDFSVMMIICNIQKFLLLYKRDEIIKNMLQYCNMKRSSCIIATCCFYKLYTTLLIFSHIF